MRRAAGGKVTEQALLARIAMEAEDNELREDAVATLTDQVLLAKIAQEDKNGSVRAAAVRKLTDQVLLARIALEDEYGWVRAVAVSKLTDQAVLAKIAVEARPGLMGVSEDGIEISWGTGDLNSDVRAAAMARLTNQALLARIAMEDEFPEAREAAVANLTDQNLLAKIALEDEDLRVCVAAIGRMTDQALLSQWAKKDSRAAIRQAVVKCIADDVFLIERLSEEPSATVRASIIETLRQVESLRQVALTAYRLVDRKHALERLNELSREAAPQVEKAHAALVSRVRELTDETDSARLLRLTLEGEYDVLRVAAAERLSDPAALEQAAMRAGDRDVLKILLKKVTDKASLNRVAASADDGAMALAAAHKSRAKSWRAIFAAATTRDANVQMLGDALAAVSLFRGKQTAAVAGVQHACLNLIRLGDESRIPEMVDLLEDYGDKTLAEDYLNCGQPDLSAAGRAWARQRGYDVNTGDGSHRATWGRGR